MIGTGTETDEAGERMDDVFLQAALCIGRRMVERAIRDGGTCTWRVRVRDAGDPRLPARVVPAQGDVYDGTAGIVLFLLALHRAAPSPAFARTAAGAVRHALGHAERLASGCGFYSGPVGLAWVATLAADTLGLDGYRDAAADVLAAHVHEDGAVDFLGGASGAIGPLLQLEARGIAGCRAMALRLAERVMETACREPQGWSGAGGASSAPRRPAGLAHGAVGCGAGLLEAFAATGDRRYAHAAEQAFLYDRRFYAPDVRSWTDFRHLGELAPLCAPDGRDAVHSTPGNGAEPFVPHSARAWCHGAPGIGLARLRAVQVLGSSYRAEAAAAAAIARAALLGPVEDFSLCHGLAGSAETLLLASEVLGDPTWRAAAEEAAADGWERFGRRGLPWPSGADGHRHTPSLMLGEAGVGYFYLRLHDPATPSILLPAAPGDPAVSQRAAA
jgi:lantibiotic modifying enzyme